jgi:C1A family cysteine protease
MSRTRGNIFKSYISFIVIVFALMLTSAFVYADSAEIEQIRQAIKARGGRWHADETSVSRLSLQEKKMRLGLRDNEELSADYLSSPQQAPVPIVTAAPPTLDWRGFEEVSYVSPIKNQGSCGSCWAFAVTAAAESQMMIANSGVPINLAEQILVSCPGGGGTCSGGSPSTASTYIRDMGLPLESCFPYTATNNLCSNACLNWQDNTYRIIGWHSVRSAVDDIKNALYAYGPVITTLYVYNDFYSYRSGVYSYSTGSYVGAHAVLAVGYDDTRQAFIVKNSWGSGWGEAGYFMIAYSEVTGTSRFGYSAIAYDGYNDGTCVQSNPTVTLSPSTTQSVPPGSMVTYTASVTNNDNSGCPATTFNLSRTVPSGWTGSFGSSSLTINPAASASTTLLVTSPTTAPGGSYTITVRATDSAASTYTASASVSVSINAPPDTTPPIVSIVSPANGSTVGKRVNIQANASDNVGISRMELYIDEALTLVTNSNRIKWSWNTVKVSNGQHTIKVKAYDGAGNVGEKSLTVTK